MSSSPQPAAIAATDVGTSGHSFPALGQGRIPALDGLRGVAILLVLLWHTIFEKGTTSKPITLMLSFGKLSWSGVDLFFVLSGFLIGGILLDAKGSPKFYKTFYARRAFRILPIYWLVLGIMALVRVLFQAKTKVYFQSQVPWFTYPIFCQNLWMACLGSFGMTALAPTWSLAIEEQFYLTAPFVIRHVNRTRLYVLLISIVACAPLLRAFMVFSVPHGRFSSYFLTPCRADALSLGIVVALLVRDRQCWRILIKGRGILYSFTFALALALVWLTYQGGEPHSTAMATFGYSVIALFYAGCLLIALIKTPVGERVLRNPWFMQLGVIAYCTYLIHMPLINAGEWAFGGLFDRLGVQIPHAEGWSELCGRVCGVIVSLMIATLSWRFFEQPLLRRGHKHEY